MTHEIAWIITPIVATKQPQRRDLRRPKKAPPKRAQMAPMAPPILYSELIVPIKRELGWLKVVKNQEETIMPEKTALSYPNYVAKLERIGG